MPHALVIAVAAILLRPAELANLGAADLVWSPCTHRLSRANRLSREKCACHLALRHAVIPHASRDCIARRLGCVGHCARALAIRSVPVTELIGLAERADVCNRRIGHVGISSAVVAAC